ncbi:uncharacterized protein LOC121003095 isoform X1 [Bufo bufo]|uniref:uncharacterized protein LOC121003095 isoform X1 n=2 Tax=Bufo bufo TaxID=8384 RepID=UPI001ABE4A40|nr:uncharacterized protein LOC121003095 isoform X1 [Bufo bufo]XP_040290602.1 uncharacterized protein LOC121003095 isoform X1 [Bufo bufo]
MERKRLRVDGIPTDIPAGRAKDKLTIHFLRSRNGGGELESIDIIQGNPTYAIVTFEDDEVVQRVLRIEDHILQVNDKIYNLVVSEVTVKLELEEVFQKLSLTVNYKNFPESCRSLLKNLKQTRKAVKFDFDEKFMMCTISGPYTEIQTLAQEILSKLEVGHTNLQQISSDTRRKAKSDRLKNSEPQDLPQHLHQRSVPPYGSADEVRYIPQTESLEQLQEPFVWDSDIFKYIQKFHNLEYQEILNRYHVRAVDESAEEITTIYLQPVKVGKNHLADLRSARSKLMGLYQGLELLLRKEQIDKRDVYEDQDFRVLLRDLQKLFPMLLCHDDDRYLYLIGNGVDVAQGKQHISDLKLKVDRPSSYVDTQLKVSGTVTMSEGVSHSLSPNYKHESKVGSRIAASFSGPTTHSSYGTKSHIDEKYLISNSPLLDREREPPYDRTSLRSEITSALLKNEDFSLSQAEEKSESKTMPSFKRCDVLPALKTGREDIRHSRSTSKPTGPLKSVPFTKASSELAYSSLVDVNSPPMDFKIPEGKLRRSSSLTRIYSTENASSEKHSNAQIFKDEVVVTDLLWHYIKQNYKSDIDSWCSSIVLMEEKQNGKITLKLKATNKTVLTLTKERLQLLCWKEDIIVTSSCFDYTTLGVKGPTDIALDEWCNLFRKCSKKVCVKLEEDKLVLIYPKEIQVHVVEEYSQHIERKTKSTRDYKMPDDGQSLHLKDKFEFSGNNLSENYIAELKHKQSSEDNFFSKPNLGPLSVNLGGEYMSQINKNQAGKYLADQTYSLVGTEPFQGIDHGNKAFFDNPVPAFLGEKSPHPKKQKDFSEDPKSSLSSEVPQTDLSTPRKYFEDLKTEVKAYDHGLYNSDVTQGIDFSPPNETDLEARYDDQAISTEGHIAQYQNSSSQLRIPAVGQESEIMDSVCVQCKNSGKTIQTSSGQNLCYKCYLTSEVSAMNDTATGKGSLRASMTQSRMSLRLPGYERDTSLKIIYNVPDGVQGAGDPKPGCQYKGGKFEAFLPDNREGNKLLTLLQRALQEGLIFHIRTSETGDKVTWYKIPHKTSPDGGKQKNGYPDLAYMKSTIALLKHNGIE